MAAVLPITLTRESLGSVTLLIANFSSGVVNTGDTWASGLGGNVLGFWGQQTELPDTQASAGLAAANSSGNFTLYPSEQSMAFTFYVIARI